MTHKADLGWKKFTSEKMRQKTSAVINEAPMRLMGSDWLGIGELIDSGNDPAAFG